MIVQAFLRWTETARVVERAKAASALARAYLRSPMSEEKHRSAALALTYLLDDPSPRVRLALAEALACSDDAPRNIVLALCEDQPEIACTVIMRSPVLTEGDLVELVAHGDPVTRGILAARPWLPRGVCAALAEVGDEVQISILLENRSAIMSRTALRRIGERFGACPDIRNLLIAREDLPSEVRHLLVGEVAAALSSSALVRNSLAPNRIGNLVGSAAEAATVMIAGEARQAEMRELVQHLRKSGAMTPAFLMHALCDGKLDFFIEAVSDLSGMDGPRVRALMATGRMHALRALFEASGLTRDIASVFVEGVFLWRKTSGSSDNISGELKGNLAHSEYATFELLEMVDKFHQADTRSRARSFAVSVSLAA